MNPLIRRLHWQSRRGTLELDLLLDKFWQQDDNLTTPQLQAMAAILSLDDNDLQRLLQTGAIDHPKISQEGRTLVARLRNLQKGTTT